MTASELLETGEITMVSPDFDSALGVLLAAGMRLERIYPAEAPHGALLTSRGTTIRLEASEGVERPGAAMPTFEPSLVVTRAGGDSGEGRAGMRYRDLIPRRLGGRYIASHIFIPGSGPVEDWVHYHEVGFQLIAVLRGRVRLVYEGQGEPFWMEAGDIVLQPPTIRHRVLESEDELEVVEIGCPALHATVADHHLRLPSGQLAPDHLFGGQRFCLHRSAEGRWVPFHGGEAQQTGIGTATSGVGEARFVRPAAARAIIQFPATAGELDLAFVMKGSGMVEVDSQTFALGQADCLVVPPGTGWRISDPSPDLLLLHVTTARPA